MTFLSDRTLARESLRAPLSQRGRSSVEFLGALQNISSGAIRPRARHDFETDPEGAKLNRAKDASKEPRGGSHRQSPRRRRKIPSFRFERFYQRFVAEEQWIRSIQAVEERRPYFEAYLTSGQKDVGGTLDLDSSVTEPAYYKGVEWHCELGGWDGFDLYGPMFFKYGGYAAV